LSVEAEMEQSQPSLRHCGDVQWEVTRKSQCNVTVRKCGVEKKRELSLFGRFTYSSSGNF